jgi:hypothetical protein
MVLSMSYFVRALVSVRINYEYYLDIVHRLERHKPQRFGDWICFGLPGLKWKEFLTRLGPLVSVTERLRVLEFSVRGSRSSHFFLPLI